MGLGRQHKIPCCFRADFSNVGYGQRSCVVKGTVGNSFTKNSAVVRDTVDTRRSKTNGLLQQMTTTARVQMRFCICGLDGLEDPMFTNVSLTDMSDVRATVWWRSCCLCPQKAALVLEARKPSPTACHKENTARQSRPFARKKWKHYFSPLVKQTVLHHKSASVWS